MTDFAPPTGSKPFTPPRPPVSSADPAHQVAGLDSAPPLFDPKPEQTGPKIGGRVDVTPEPTAAPEEVRLPRLCLNCGWDTNAESRPDAPSIEDKRAWVSHILGEPRFRSTYKLYGDEVTVVMRSRTTPEDDEVFRQLNEDLKSGSLSDHQPTMFSAEYAHRMHTYFMSLCVESVTSKTGKVAYKAASDIVLPAATGGAPVADRLRQLKSSISEGLFLNLIEVQRKFESMLRMLIARGSDPSFWEPTAG